MDFYPFTNRKAQRVADYLAENPVPNWTATVSKVISRGLPKAGDWILNLRHALPGTAPHLAPQLAGDEFPVNFEVGFESVRIMVEQRYSFREFDLSLFNLPDRIPPAAFPKNFPYRKVIARLYPEFLRIMGEALAIGHEELHTDTSEYDEAIMRRLKNG